MPIVNRRGQVTIPKHVRDAVGLKPGHRVECAVTDDGQVVIHKAGTVLRAELDRFDRATG
jgi:AbrB family looped-hinge helix DNA binding protein